MLAFVDLQLDKCFMRTMHIEKIQRNTRQIEPMYVKPVEDHLSQK